MPSGNPRLMIVVTPEQRELLADLAKLQKRSSAAIVRDLVDAATPLFRALRGTLQRAAAVTEAQPALVHEIVSQALQDAYRDDPAQLVLMQAVNDWVLEGETEAVGEARADRSDGRSEDRTDLDAPPPAPAS